MNNSIETQMLEFEAKKQIAGELSRSSNLCGAKWTVDVQMKVRNLIRWLFISLHMLSGQLSCSKYLFCTAVDDTSCLLTSSNRLSPPIPYPSWLYLLLLLFFFSLCLLPPITHQSLSPNSTPSPLPFMSISPSSIIDWPLSHPPAPSALSVLMQGLDPTYQQFHSCYKCCSNWVSPALRFLLLIPRAALPCVMSSNGW